MKNIIIFFWKVNNSIEKELDYEPIYNKIILKIKVRSYGDDDKEFNARKKPDAGSNYIWWSVILIDSVLEKDENCYPEVTLKECKYIEKEKKWLDILLITDYKFSSNYFDESDEE